MIDLSEDIKRSLGDIGFTKESTTPLTSTGSVHYEMWNLVKDDTLYELTIMIHEDTDPTGYIEVDQSQLSAANFTMSNLLETLNEYGLREPSYYKASRLRDQ
ncbi:hypothetical protein CEW46_27675 [Bacillus cereus]|nr:hypothetical protein CEW46_27675 [Bacillus cereus]